MRVLTLNLWGKSGNWEERRRVLLDGLRELQPDLVAFQEPIVNDDYDQVADLLGPGFHVAHETRGLVPEGKHQGASIASRWPVRNVQEVDLHLTPRTADFPCTTLLAEVLAPEPIGPLLFVNHFPSWQPAFEHERELQAVAASRAIEALVAERMRHVVLVGDFTADPDSANVRFLTGRQSLGGVSVCYRDAWESAHPDEPGYTNSAQHPLATPGARNRRIDYILVRCDEHRGPTLAIEACALAFAGPVDGVWASDHFGVFADLASRTPSSRS